MATTIASFNAMLLEFVTELSETFPEYASISVFNGMLPSFIKQDEMYGVNTFMKTLQPYGNLILTQNDELFEKDISLGPLKLKDLWHAPGLSEESKKAIWSYIMNLFVLGMTLNQLNPQMLSGIEDLAKRTAAQMKASGNFDLSSMLPSLIQGVGNIVGAGDLGGKGGGMDDMTNMIATMADNPMFGGLLGGSKPAIMGADDKADDGNDIRSGKVRDPGQGRPYPYDGQH